MEVASAVRIPSPEPELSDLPETEPEHARKRAPSPFDSEVPSKRYRRDDREEGYHRERSRDRERERHHESRRDRENGRRNNDEDRRRQHDEDKNGTRRPPEEPAEDDARLKVFQNAFSAPKKLAVDDSKTRAGGAYIPPARLRQMQAQITDKTSPEYQRIAWEALKKSIQGLINKCNVANIKALVPELFQENLIRGRGIFCRFIQKAQAASLPFTNIYACMVAVVNTKLPQVGDLLVRRLIVQFRKAYRRNDKAVSIASTMFLAHLVNTQVVHEVLIAEILLLLLNKPTDDSVEIAVGIMREVGAFLEEMNGAIASAIFDQFRNILHESDIDKRTQYMIEVLFQVRKEKYCNNPAVKEELDLVEEEDQHTHRHTLDDDLKTEDTLNIFKFDAEYEEHESQYQKLKAEILGEEEDGSDYTDASDEDETDEEEKELEVKDQTNADLVKLRRTIYLTIKSSGLFEEAVHKLMRVDLPTGLESEMCSMIIECASQERTYEKFYGQIGERFAKLNRMWADLYEEQFAHYYETVHRLENNRLRIIAQFFANLLATDAIGWHVLMVIKLNEEDTTSSSRIFVKILFEELMSSVGQKNVVERLKDPAMQESVAGLFPMDADDQSKTRFSINFFTAIGMGSLTEGMREWLKNAAPKPAPLPEPESESDSETVSSYSSRSRSRSRSPVRRRRDSRSSSRGRSYSRSESPVRRKGRGRSPSYSSDSRSRSPVRRRKYSSSPLRSPAPRRRGRSPSSSASRSKSPVEKRRRYSSSVSRSPAPARRRRRDSDSHLSRRRDSDSRSRRRDSDSPWQRRRDSHTPPRTKPANSGSLSDKPLRRRKYSSSPERSPPRRGRQYSSSVSRSPPPKRGGRRRDSS